MTEQRDETRSARKQRAILAAARTTFLRNGYLGTNMDQIAALAEVSKQTIYKQFGDKEQLFVGTIRALVDRAADPLMADIEHLAGTADLETDLRTLVRRFLELVLDQELLELRRLIIAESRRFPELGRMFYAGGPRRTVDALTEALRGLDAAGLLRIPDARLAATQLNWLVLAEPLNRAMFLPADDALPADELAAHTEAGLRTFLAAHRPAEPGARPDGRRDRG